MVVLGGRAFSCERGSPVVGYLRELQLLPIDCEISHTLHAGVQVESEGAAGKAAAETKVKEEEDVARD